MLIKMKMKMYKLVINEKNLLIYKLKKNKKIIKKLTTKILFNLKFINHTNKLFNTSLITN